MRRIRLAVLACLFAAIALWPVGLGAQTPTPTATPVVAPTATATPRPPTGTFISGSIPAEGGFGLVVFGGGTYAQLTAASGCEQARVAFWVTNPAGQFVVFVPGAAVGAVNAPFQALLPNDFVPWGTPLVGRCQPRAGGSGVQGLVTVGPVCPVVSDLLPCPDRPYQATLVFLDGGGREVARTVSGADGRYRIALPPGPYTLVPLSPPGVPFPNASSIQLQVPVDRYVTVDVPYDSGIRTAQGAP
jgi:hypothetical protein